MGNISDRGGNIDWNPHCRHCTNSDGKLLPKKKIREGMIEKRLSEVKTTREKAEKWVDSYMKKMPEWKDK